MIRLCCKSLNFKCFHLSLNEAGCDSVNSDIKNLSLINELCIKLYETSLNNIVCSEYYILLDECQTVYHVAPFWLLIKDRSNVIAAASYGEKFLAIPALLSVGALTPSCFAVYLKGAQVMLTYEEYPKLVSFIQKSEVDWCNFKKSIYYDMLFNYCMSLEVALESIVDNEKRAHIGLISTLLISFLQLLVKLIWLNHVNLFLNTLLVRDLSTVLPIYAVYIPLRSWRVAYQIQLIS